MGSIQYRSVEEIAETLRGRKARKRKCSLLIGAGVSATAGIPTAAQFVEIIKQREPLAYGRANEKTYPRCMAQLLRDHQRDLIAEFVDKAKINWAHIGIALLMKEGFVDRVLTTNFDPLVMRACAMLGVFPAVYDFATSQLLKNADIPDLAVFHLHGQRTGFVLMNTFTDLLKHSERLGPLFDDAGSGRTWIVVGYSGETDPVFEHLARQVKFDSGLIWVGYKDVEPAAHVRDRLLDCDKDASFTAGHDADSFFVNLTRELEIFPPDVVARPFTYVRRTLEQLTPFLQPGQSVHEDVLYAPNKWIESAMQQFETPAWNLITRGSDLEAGLPNLSVVQNAAHYFSMKGDYERVVALRSELGDPADIVLADVISKAYVMLGNRLLDRAKTAKFEQARVLFEEAVQQYEAALSIQPGRHEALHNWANFLLDLAKACQDVAVARSYFDDADARYAAAHAVNSTEPEILINWGNLALDRAKSALPGDDASALFAQAEARYRHALRIKPQLANVWYSLGNLLLDQGKAKPKDEALAFFAKAEVQYRKAIALNPEMAEVYYQLGNLFLDRAKRAQGQDRNSLFKSGIENYQQALLVRPSMHEALNNWASLLVDFGKSGEDEDADGLFEQAQRRYGQATVMKPDFNEAWANWGNLLLDWRKRKTGTHAARLFEQAQEKYRTAHGLRPDIAETLDNWGNLFLDHAKTFPGGDADEWFDAACEKYRAAHALRPTLNLVLNNWGNCLSDQARRTTSDEGKRTRLLSEAREKYRAALAIRSNVEEVVRNYANLLVDVDPEIGQEGALKIIAAELEDFQPGTKADDDTRE